MWFKPAMRLAVVALAAVACTAHAETDLDSMEEFNATVGVLRVAGYQTVALMGDLIEKETANKDDLEERFQVLQGKLETNFYDNVPFFSGSFDIFFKEVDGILGEKGVFKENVKKASAKTLTTDFFSISPHAYRASWQFIIETMAATVEDVGDSKLTALYEKYKAKVGPAHKIDFDVMGGDWNTLRVINTEMRRKAQDMDKEFNKIFRQVGTRIIVDALQTHFAALNKLDPADAMLARFAKKYRKEAFGDSSNSSVSSSSASSTSGSDSVELTEAPSAAGSTEGSGAPVANPVASPSTVPAPAPTSGASAVFTAMAASAFAVVAAVVL